MVVVWVSYIAFSMDNLNNSVLTFVLSFIYSRLVYVHGSALCLLTVNKTPGRAKG